MRYVRYADDVRSRNSVKTWPLYERTASDNNNPQSKNTIENRDDDDDDNRWEAGDKEGGRGGGSAVEISLENNPFSGSGKEDWREKRREGRVRRF